MELRGPGALYTVEKPWGREVWWAQTDRYVGKRIEVWAGHALSLQYHRFKHETLYFLCGRARLRVGDETREVEPGSAVTLPPGTVHRIEALTDITFFEVSTPEVNDVVRLEDRYGRVGAGPGEERREPRGPRHATGEERGPNLGPGRG